MWDLRTGIENAFFQAFAAFGGDPKFRITQEPDHLRCDSGTKEAFLNNVFKLRAADLTRQRIHEIAASYQERPFIWRLGPSNGGLLATSRLLGECGYVHIGASPGMVLTSLQKMSHPNIELVSVNTPALLQTWYEVWQRGFQMSDAVTQYCWDLFRNQKFYENPAFALFLGKAQGKPVVCGNSYFDGEYTGLFNIAVLPEYRRQGWGGALTSHCAEQAQKNGGPVYLFSSPEGFSLYRALGFETACTLEQFVANP